MPRNVLLVANRTAPSHRLRRAVAERAQAQDTCFHLVVPAEPRGLHRIVDPEVAGRDAAQERLEGALPGLCAAAGSEVTASVGDAEPLCAIADALSDGDFDEIVISTLPRQLSRWLRLDLPSKVRGLGLPVEHVEAEDAVAPLGARAA
jgi:hypothetical protein